MAPTPITIQTASPRGSFPGAVAQAYYVVDNNKVALTDRQGNTLHDPEGREYTKELAKDDNPREIAARLLRNFRTKLRGSTPNGFDRGPINFGPGPKY
jgi:hypothetical protein